MAKHTEKLKNKVKDVNGFVMSVVYYALRLYFWLCGLRIKTVSKVSHIDKPSIVLCNHGSFIDFIFAAAFLHKNKPNFITGDMIKKDAVVIDVGTTKVDGKLTGDVKFDEVFEIASFITPVPKGVGPMTIASLLENIVLCYRKQKRIEELNN